MLLFALFDCFYQILYLHLFRLFVIELQLKDKAGVCNRETNHAAWFRTNLRNRGYEGYYNKKIVGNCTVAILWRKDKFGSQGVWSDFNNLQQNVAAGGPSQLVDTVEVSYE